MKLAGPKNTSLFLALCVSFSVIILLLMSFNFLAYAFFRENIRNEMIKNTSLNLNTTVSNYEKHYAQVKSELMAHLFRSEVQTIRTSTNRPSDYQAMQKIQRELKATLNSSVLHLENLVYYFREKELFIDKDGSRSGEMLFSKLYYSGIYDEAFWREELQKMQSFRIYPGARFEERTSFGHSDYGILLPVLAKKEYDAQFALIAWLDGQAMYSDFLHTTESGGFYIIDANGSTLFASSDRPTENDPPFLELTGEGYIEQGDNIFVYQQARDSGYLYVDIIPMQHIASQFKRLNAVFAMILLSSCVLSFVTALFIARRFQHPLNRILQTIEKIDIPGAQKSSRITEFKLIADKFSDLFKHHASIHRDLDNKNSLLQHYGYLSRLKMISSNVTDIKMAIDNNRPYRLVLVHLLLKKQALADTGIEANRSYALLTELIRMHFESRQPEALTFQIEQDQVLTILFGQPDEQEDPRHTAQPLVSVLQPETLYFDFTIGISPQKTEAQQFSETYDQVVEFIRQRRLDEAVQVFAELQPVSLPVVPTLAQDQELATNLDKGNDTICIPLVHKWIEQLHKAGAPASQIHALSKQIVDKATKIIYAKHLTIAGFENPKQPYEALNQCRTVDELKTFFRRFLIALCEAVRGKNQDADSDYMISFVKDYVEAHYGEDISLDHLADKLNITPTYLSAYFKEKSGINLSEYTHRFRMEKAKEMLENTDLKIQDIASLVGYLTVAPFNRAFKRYTGSTPTEYRRLHQTLD